MNSSLSLDIDSIKKPFISILKHFTFIATVLVFGYLIYSVITVNQLLSMPEDQSYIDEQQTVVVLQFNDDVIKKITQLRRDDQMVSTDLPNTRINPFVEE